MRTRGNVFGGRTTVLGHRGSGRDTVDGHVENSVDSLLAGVASGLRWVELDVRRTADDVLVVGHHPTTGSGDFVADVDLARARALGVVTLEEVLAALPDGIGVNLDLKTSLEDALRPRDATTAALLAPVVAEVAEHRPLLVSSFDPAALLALEEPRRRSRWVCWRGSASRCARPSPRPSTSGSTSSPRTGPRSARTPWTGRPPSVPPRTPWRSPTARGWRSSRGARPPRWPSSCSRRVDAVVVDDVPRTLPALAGLCRLTRTGPPPPA